MGSHNMVCGDVDEDGKDEILLGSCMLDDNWTLLWLSLIHIYYHRTNEENVHS